MLTRIGIKTNVDAMTASTFFTRRNKYEFSLYLAGWGADTGEMLEPPRRPRRDAGHQDRPRPHQPRPLFEPAARRRSSSKAQPTVDEKKREEPPAAGLEARA